jgi:catechol 2,3-dioxygenase-like lactoylglutathione lyase family enzyme
MRIAITALRVLDQDRALRFYTETLGFQKVDDVNFGEMRWLTVSPAEQPELQVLLEKPGPPFVDPETAEQIATLTAKGVMGTLFFEVDDCRALVHAQVVARVVAERRVDAVEPLRRLLDDLDALGDELVEEPTERFYGIDAAFRDDSGNHLRMNQRAPAPAAQPSR